MDITSNNAIIAITVPDLYPVPVFLEGFAADDIYDVDSISIAESIMGADGQLSAGFVFSKIPQNFTLQASSQSNLIFENIYQSSRNNRRVYQITLVVTLTSIGRIYRSSKGFLVNYKPLADAKRVLQPRKFTIDWESMPVIAI